MDVLILTLIASLALVGVGVLFLVKRILEGDVEHGDRLSLLPLADDEHPLPHPEAEAVPGLSGGETPPTGSEPPQEVQS
jgi:hypothetical protein